MHPFVLAALLAASPSPAQDAQPTSAAAAQPVPAAATRPGATKPAEAKPAKASPAPAVAAEPAVAKSEPAVAEPAVAKARPAVEPAVAKATTTAVKPVPAAAKHRKAPTPAPAPAPAPAKPAVAAPTSAPPDLPKGPPLEKFDPTRDNRKDQALAMARQFVDALLRDDPRGAVALCDYPFQLEDRRFTDEAALQAEWIRQLHGRRMDLLTLYGIEILNPDELEKRLGPPPARLASFPRGRTLLYALVNLSGHGAVLAIREFSEGQYRVVGYTD